MKLSELENNLPVIVFLKSYHKYSDITRTSLGIIRKKITLGAPNEIVFK